MTTPAKPSRRRVLLGEICGAHGIRGAVLVRTFTAEPRSIAAYGTLEDEAGRRRFTLAVERITPKGVIARIEGVGDRTEAERLRGLKLYVGREHLPPAAPGDFYRVDLIGLTAVDERGAAIGVVVGVENYGAGDLLEIRLAGSRTSEFLPLAEAFVKRVELEAGRIVLSMPVESPDEKDVEEG
jgi:16S rRNA processing protein RimM